MTNWKGSEMNRAWPYRVNVLKFAEGNEDDHDIKPQYYYGFIPYANEWLLCKHYWDPIRVHSPLRLETYYGPEDDHMNGRNMQSGFM